MNPNLITYKESNINIVCWLKVAGASLVETDSSDSNSIVWHFAEPEKCEKLVADYHLGKAVVDPRTLLLEYKRLKDDLFANRRSRSGGANYGQKFDYR